jgi:hypothetical protein
VLPEDLRIEAQESDDDDNGSEYDPDGADPEKEKEARKRVMNCDLNNYRETLGVKEAYNTLKEEKAAILKAYRDLGTLIHPN